MRSLAWLGRPRPETETATETDQASAALFLLPARLKLITGHKSWPAYQRQRQRRRWPDPQLVAMPWPLPVPAPAPASCSRLLIRATLPTFANGVKDACVLSRIDPHANETRALLAQQYDASLSCHSSLPLPLPQLITNLAKSGVAAAH